MAKKINVGEKSLFPVDVAIDEHKSLRQSNRLVEANYTLSLAEMKIMMAIISQLDNNADSFEYSRMSVEQLGLFCGFNAKSMYRQIQQATKKLMSRVIVFRLPNGGEYITHWVQSFRYDKENSTVTYHLDKELQPELLQLKQAYVSEKNPKMLMKFNSIYAIRLYMMLKQYLRIGQRKFLPEELIAILQLSEGYKNSFSNLRIRVIEPSLEEINAISDIEVSVEYIKHGNHKVVGIVFSIGMKPGIIDDCLSVHSADK